ncbi:oligosaccharide repeat unit polymerase [Paenibacillus lutrae]|uniref:Oligosaccharide repeat unit polymerase n=1 Tax=Paenibacillus lutrae TaxID=2078573 RepID=A0A7X3FG81_9BACL|nr:oligosaccharide repeat unit polymerase [Paenibacillus lutrae]MVO99205.1 oligosaccharide repeat unit polymerase [Paenibacillus lutrae]
MIALNILNLSFMALLAFVLGVKFFKKKLFTAFDFFVIGIIVYYLIPFSATEIFLPDRNTFQTTVETKVYTFLVIFVSTLIALVGYKMTNKVKLLRVADLKLFPVFKQFIGVISIAIFFYIIWIYITKIDFSNLEHNMQLRELLSGLGPFAVLLQIPNGLALYYIYRAAKYKENYKLATIWMIVALMTTFIRGERTDLVFIALFPFLAWYFYKKTAKPIIVGIVVISIILSIYSANFKVTHINNDEGYGQTAIKMIEDDFDRNWVTWAAIDNASLTKSELLPYRGSGYVYTLLGYVPRSIAPFKGYNSPQWFTLNISPQMGYTLYGVSDVSELDWGYAFGFQVESILNFGFIGLVVVSFFVGVALRFLQNLLVRFEVLYPIIAIMALQFSALTSFTLMTIHLPILVTALIIYMSSDRKETSTHSAFANAALAR